jgi:FKBP-type peptidyl-prolyl cis-trans isomerase SlyD
MQKAKLGDRVRIQCLQLSQHGDSTKKPHKSKTLEFTVGSREVVSGLSLAVEDMGSGDRKRLSLEPHDAYGPIQQSLIREIPRRSLSKQIALHVGKWLMHVEPVSGHRERVRIIEVKPLSIVVDGNHPLAGKVFELDIRLVSVNSSSHANEGKQQFDVGGEA